MRLERSLHDAAIWRATPRPNARAKCFSRPGFQAKQATKERAMKTTLTVAALALAIAAPAFAQDAKPATTPPIAPMAKPAEAPKAQPAASKDTVKPAVTPATTKAGDAKDAKKVDPAKVDPKAAAPAAPTGGAASVTPTK